MYIACPMTRGDHLHNARQADGAMLALMQAGYAPFNPALSAYAGGATTLFAKGEYRTSGDGTLTWAPEVWSRWSPTAGSSFADLTHADWLDMDFAWVSVSDAVLRLPGESAGADRETAYAAERGVPVFTDIAALRRHFEPTAPPTALTDHPA